MKKQKLFCGALLSLIAVTTLAAQKVSFNVPPRDFPAGGTALGLATGDFNGDGKLDVVSPVALTPSANGIAVLLGTGYGGFQAPIITPVSNIGVAVVGDFNSDGKLDLAMTIGFNEFVVQLGNGDGTFQAQVVYSLGVPASNVEVADLNNDGIPDLVFASYSKKQGFVAVSLGKGDGTFLPAKTFATAVPPTAFTVGDFNHDGNIDVAVAGDPAPIEVLLGTGTGSFLPGVSSGSSVAIASMVAADLNGDGTLDLVANPITTLQPVAALVFSGIGDGTFHEGVPFAFAGTVTAIADMNNDGKLDLVGTNSIRFAGNAVFVANGKGDGTFGNPVSTPAGAGPFPLVGHFRATSAAPDLVSAGGGGAHSVTLLLNKGNGTFVEPTPVKDSGGAGQTILTDLNHDGKLDVVTVRFTEIGVSLGEGQGVFQTAVSYAAGANPGSVVVGDFNHDGNPDLAVTNNLGANTISILFGNGDGTFQPARTLEAGGPFVAGILAAADFNRDGHLDLALSSDSSGAVLVLLGNGDGTFQPTQTVPLGFAPQFVVAADLNHDGKADLVSGGSGMVTVLLGSGKGTFRAGTVYTSVPTTEFPASVGDVNGDGNADLVIPGYSDAQTQSGISVLLGNGDGTFQPPTTFGGSYPNAAVLADFNGDGKLDVAIADYQEGNNVPVMLGNGDGTFNAPTYFPGGFSPHGIATGNLNGDSKADLAIGSGGGVIVLLNETR